MDIDIFNGTTWIVTDFKEKVGRSLKGKIVKCGEGEAVPGERVRTQGLGLTEQQFAGAYLNRSLQGGATIVS